MCAHVHGMIEHLEEVYGQYRRGRYLAASLQVGVPPERGMSSARLENFAAKSAGGAAAAWSPPCNTIYLI